MRIRRGFTLIELSVAGVLLAVVVVATLQLLAAWAAASRTERQRQVALNEVDNLLERLAARPWNELMPEQRDDLALSPSAAAILPGARLSTKVVELTQEGVPARQIAVEICYGGADQRERSVRLVAWRYPAEEGPRP